MAVAIERGIFAVYKPPGMTSADVTNVIKRILQANNALNQRGVGQRQKLKVGHGGTLDKGAEGVLVIGIGRDCKQLNHFLQGTKEYVGIGRLGVTTDSLDSTGSVIAEAPWEHVTKNALVHALERFTGDQLQTPPVISALKIKGKRMADLARSGNLSETYQASPRSITISKLELLEYTPPEFKITVTCSKGTYIRSLIRDLGVHLGTVAHMVYLCRTRHGDGFTLEHALTQEDWTAKKIASKLEPSLISDNG